jgi:23S rRNA pseudouridine2605 synthase
MTDAMPAGGSDGPCRERLHAFLARAGVASRRAGERLIGAGRVAVNGRHVTTQGNTVGPGDRVTLDGREVAVTAASVSVALHKPAGYLCSNHDPGNRPLARALLPAAAGRLFHVGRLDLASSGLILFTNNGQLAVRATHPRFGVEKEYEVFTDRGVPISVLEQYRAGLAMALLRFWDCKSWPSGASSLSSLFTGAQHAPIPRRRFAMDLRIEGRNMVVGRRLEAQVKRKLDQVLRHIPAAEDVRLEITHEPTRSRQESYLAQLSFNVKGTVIRSERRGSSAIVATHGAATRLDQLAARFKGQVYRSQRTHSCVSLSEQQAAEALEEDMELARQHLPNEESEAALTL